MQELRNGNESALCAGMLCAGMLVDARRAQWMVRAARRADGVTLVHLIASEPREPATRALLSPFDRVTPAARRAATRVSRRRWMRTLRALAAEVCPFDVPASVAAADIVLLPYQLEPLLALRAGIATRLLVADEVGLGKTIQAALVARDLVDRSPDAATLIVTPAGLRAQWQQELRDRVGLEATLADAAWLQALETSLPPGVNAWRLARLVVASIDFVKQPEILRGLQAVLWSLLIVDEAHMVAPGTDRFDAVTCLARQSERVLLLTATPHDGDDRRYAALCGLGRMGGDEPLAIFRRTRDALARATALQTTPRRVSCRLRVAPSAAEVRLHGLLERYVGHVWRDAPETTRAASRLAMSVLVKRAASSPWSLEQSLRRRRELLAGETGALAQSALDFGAATRESDDRDAADAAPDAVLGVAALPPDRERTWLNLLIHAASTATAGERKLAALERLLRRTRDPAIVFTEYRDTLQRVASALGRRHTVTCLHGGLDADARRRALDAFASGAARVLLSTDAGSQGLNLQHRCRLVVHVELPWNPLRLDQRNGRVDRIGQSRTVHAIHLIGRDMAEARIEARLGERRRRIDAAMDRAPLDEVTVLGETLIPPLGSPGASAPGLAGSAGRPVPPAPGAGDAVPSDSTGPESAGNAAPVASRHGAPIDHDVTWPSLSLAAGRAVSHLEWLRSVRPSQDATVSAHGSTPRLTRLPPRAARRLGLGRGLLTLHRTRLRDTSGAIRETSVDVRHVPRAHRARWADEECLASLLPHLQTRAAERLEVVRSAADRADDTVNRRRQAMRRWEVATRQPDQLDLFDDLPLSRAAPSPGVPRSGVEVVGPDASWSAEVTGVLVAVLG